MSLSSLWSTVRSFIATTGMNITFISFMAHMGFSFMLLCIFPHILTLIGVVVGAALKEFWFDASYEVPTQTASDNWTDFGGYMAGVVLFLLLAFGVI